MPDNVFGWYAETYATAKEKDRDPRREFVWTGVGPAKLRGPEERSEVEQ